jgi:type IV secretory pathway TrbF-like protein
VAYAEKSSASNPRLIQGMLKRFIVDFRNVSSDPVVQKQATDRLYKMVPEGSASLERINAYYKENSPFVIGQTGTVQVELIGNPLPASDKSWQIEWYETKRTNTGAVLGKPIRYKAIIAIAIYTPNDDQVLDLDNPIGLYVPELNWSQQL